MKVTLLAAMSVDGYIARHTDELADWTSKEDKRFFVRKTKEAGVLVMGRTTYETIGRPLPGRLNVVLTSSPDQYEGQEGLLEYTNEVPEDLLARLREAGHQEVVIAGGGSVYAQFLREGHVTDMYLTVEPHLFGSGVSLAPDACAKLSLRSFEPLGEQAILIHYEVIYDQSA